MSKLPLLEALVNLNEIKSIKTNKIYNFLNKYDKNKIKTWEILINIFRCFDERIKIKRMKMDKNECKNDRKIKINALKWWTQNKLLGNIHVFVKFWNKRCSVKTFRRIEMWPKK